MVKTYKGLTRNTEELAPVADLSGVTSVLTINVSEIYRYVEKETNPETQKERETRNKDAYLIHDWTDHNGWASGAKARSGAASKAAKARWDNRLGIKLECPDDADSVSQHCDRMPRAVPHLHLQFHLRIQIHSRQSGRFWVARLAREVTF